MSVEDRMERTTVGIWRVLAVVIAVALMVNAVQAVAGKAEFAWWHLGTLGIAMSFGEMGTVVTRLGAVARLLRLRWRGCSIQKAIRTRGC